MNFLISILFTSMPSTTSTTTTTKTPSSTVPKTTDDTALKLELSAPALFHLVIAAAKHEVAVDAALAHRHVSFVVPIPALVQRSIAKTLEVSTPVVKWATEKVLGPLDKLK